jgi:GNAT superfamily N-acetyltransferase
MMNYKIQFFKESEALAYIPELAKLRIEIFKEYPYLYDGDFEYEQKYLSKFVHAPESLIALVFDTDKIVGAFSGLPMRYEEGNLQSVWEEELDSLYYFSELLLLPGYRKFGIGSQLMSQAEKWVEQLDTEYTKLVLATVIRAENHPSKPIDYQSLNTLWEKFDYTLLKGKTCTIAWKELGEIIESEKPMQFWSKELL